MTYKECRVLCNLNLKSEPLVTTVPLDEFTDMVQNNFDYEFTGTSEVYPYELPSEIKDNRCEYNSIVIVGASGSGKSTLLREFNTTEYKLEYDDRAIVSNFDSKQEAIDRLSAVGLNSMPVWCRPRRVLSVGEGFRADVALNLKSNVTFDEFTSTIDRNVAKSTCNGISNFIKKYDMKGIVFCSCHSDYIPYLNPDIVIDLDEEKVYDCRGVDLKKGLNYKYTNPVQKINGTYLGSIII